MHFRAFPGVRMWFYFLLTSYIYFHIWRWMRPSNLLVTIWVYSVIHGLSRGILIDIRNKPAISFHLSLFIKRGQRDRFIAIVLGKWATTWRELPFPGASFQLINNIQLDETLKDHKIILPFLPRIEVFANNVPLLHSHNTAIWETERRRNGKGVGECKC